MPTARCAAVPAGHHTNGEPFGNAKVPSCRTRSNTGTPASASSRTAASQTSAPAIPARIALRYATILSTETQSLQVRRVVHADAVAIDEISALPSAVKQDQHNDDRDVDAGRRDEVRVLEAKREIDDFKDHRGHVG